MEKTAPLAGKAKKELEALGFSVYCLDDVRGSEGYSMKYSS